MKIRFAQLEAAYAAFNKYAALIIAKTRAQSGGGSLPHPQDAVIMLKSVTEKSICITSGQGGGCPANNFFKEINFFVEHQNEYCTEFVEYVFSEWARTLPVDTLSMAKTSVDENQI